MLQKLLAIVAAIPALATQISAIIAEIEAIIKPPATPATRRLLAGKVAKLRTVLLAGDPAVVPQNILADLQNVANDLENVATAQTAANALPGLQATLTTDEGQLMTDVNAWENQAGK